MDFRWILDGFYRDTMMVALLFIRFSTSASHIWLHLDGHVSLFVIGAKDMSIEGLDGIMDSSWTPNGWAQNIETRDIPMYQKHIFSDILSMYFQIFYQNMISITISDILFKPSILIMFDHFDSHPIHWIWTCMTFLCIKCIHEAHLCTSKHIKTILKTYKHHVNTT